MIWRAAGMRRLLGSSVGGARVGVALLFVALVVAWTVAYFATAHFTLLTSPSAFALLPVSNATSRAWLQRLQSSLSVQPQQGQPPQPQKQKEPQENGQQGEQQEQGRQGQHKDQSAGRQDGDKRDKREQKFAKQNETTSHASGYELLTQEQQHVGKQADGTSWTLFKAQQDKASEQQQPQHVGKQVDGSKLTLFKAQQDKASEQQRQAAPGVPPPPAATAAAARGNAASGASGDTATGNTTADAEAPVTVTAANDGPVAICLVGGARDFEATWPSILRHVISRYPPAHLFLHSPLDERASKLWALLLAAPATPPNTTAASSAANSAAGAASNSTEGAVSIAAVRIFPSADIAETDEHRAVLTSNGSPHGIQGLLHYFRLVEGCIDLISTHQQQHNISYRWVIRTRVDGYWTAPPPLLTALHPSAYTIPFGFDWGGLNDRLGIGSWAASQVALRRLSALQDLFSAGYRALTSEKAFRAQMEVGGVVVTRKHFHFCVVTRRRSRGGDGCAAMMFSTATYGPLNGAKCRPCSSPCAADDQAAALINAVRAAGGMYRHPLPPGLQLCDAKQAWEGAWERQFDRDVEKQRGGKTLSWQRRNIGRVAASLAHCTEQFEKLKAMSVTWESPPPVAVCIRAQLGEVELLGSKTGQFNTFTSLLTSKS
ncbi:unnamed protein product [Closterium sp. Naga37s-1]|nr:unnamed protein product [Closterium sp. Naga37s-1]